MKIKILVIAIIIGIFALGLIWHYYRHHNTEMDVIKEYVYLFTSHEKPYIVRLEENDSEYTINLDDAIQYSHSIHVSVGLSYRLIYDKNAFKISCHTKYDNSNAADMCGGDSANTTCTLKSIKKGIFIVKAIHEFRAIL